MSHRQKLEQVLDLLINEEHEAASELLHSVIVEKARTMYEELVDEDFGGDEKEDFADEIDADKDEVEDAEDGSDDFEDESEEAEESDEDDGEEDEVEDRLEDVEDALAQLQAEFDRLVGGDEEFDAEGDDELEMGDFEGEEDFGADDFGGDFEEEDYEGLGEATKLQDAVPAVPNQEGRLAGTGKNSKTGATGKESMFTRAPRKADHGGKEHPIGKGGDEKGMKAGQGKENTPSDNINAPQKKQGADMGTGKLAGTGKGSKLGAENPKSTLGSKGNPTGA